MAAGCHERWGWHRNFKACVLNQNGPIAFRRLLHRVEPLYTGHYDDITGPLLMCLACPPVTA
ncbi:hypothetical protein PLUA15_240023 [Pseudomonas lundensis]|uniref:Uncharacterized protein n=1 Tax=Pseudomonas lundensis TaxID=86185 RepID=A0AAX2H8L7_9PSED|nr:hypothetical protein PLUA15_240023 [Pseudomonas lundensis]